MLDITNNYLSFIQYLSFVIGVTNLTLLFINITNKQMDDHLTQNAIKNLDIKLNLIEKKIDCIWDDLSSDSHSSNSFCNNDLDDIPESLTSSDSESEDENEENEENEETEDEEDAKNDTDCDEKDKDEEKEAKEEDSDTVGLNQTDIDDYFQVNLNNQQQSNRTASPSFTSIFYPWK